MKYKKRKSFVTRLLTTTFVEDNNPLLLSYGDIVELRVINLLSLRW